ncbi:hypothetical protein N7466_000760 [Penicillium verhagenii]|uniref:uncharacterized protein n=1 Tax=Penicillium verhagenii TaxID=1562060 RepID=UPI002545418B|nr:uncharacterized protein N7466_000760 [Penicillium verhagenii]KAJ5947745.1 hypothetical protein N7466_000760 [Penicillium verhagenii]
MKCFPGPETGLSRIALRILSVLAAVGGIVAVSGVRYYAEQFYYYFIHCCPPGYCIFVDFIIFAASAFLIVVSSFGAAFGGFGLVGRAIAVFVFAVLAL